MCCSEPTRLRRGTLETLPGLGDPFQPGLWAPQLLRQLLPPHPSIPCSIRETRPLEGGQWAGGLRAGQMRTWGSAVEGAGKEGENLASCLHTSLSTLGKVTLPGLQFPDLYNTESSLSGVQRGLSES